MRHLRHVFRFSGTIRVGLEEFEEYHPIYVVQTINHSLDISAMPKLRLQLIMLVDRTVCIVVRRISVREFV